MSYVRIWTHVVFGTKDRFPFLKDGIRSKLIAHIYENATSKEINIIRMNGYHDHLHCLISMNAELSIAKTVQLIKGESAFWINRNELTSTKFEWGEQYYAVSVSDFDLERVKIYIDNQVEHHKSKTFKEEYDELMDELRLQHPGLKSWML